MLKFTIKPHDVLFFGSGKPFNIGGVADSVFPPFPNSFASAVYAKFYSETGIALQNGKGIYKAVYGPFLEKEGKTYFPAPADIMKEKKKEDKGKIATSCLQDNFNLLNIQDTDLDKKLNALLWTKAQNTDIDYEPFRGFISLDGLKKWYNGQKIDSADLLLEKDVYVREDRISIYKDDATGTVKEENGLYRVGFVRLKEDMSLVFWIEADYSDGSLLFQKSIKSDEELIKFFNTSPTVLKIGGESRTAAYKVEVNDFKDLFKGFSNTDSGKYKITFLTPGIFLENERNKETILNNFSDFQFITGSIGGYIISGISSRNYDKYKNKTVRAIKPGSVVYLESPNNGFNGIIDFYKPEDSFIGSNLVLIKTI